MMLRTLWLVHPEEAMCAAFRNRFAGFPNVRVIRATFEDLDAHDCFVTAGNSFGLMTAGIDAAVVRFFGEELMQRIQHRIMDQFFGEQPVGTAFSSRLIGSIGTSSWNARGRSIMTAASR
jgi:hypothetical protein